MRFKLILLTSILLNITTATQADFKQNLKATCGGITTAAGIYYSADFIKFFVNRQSFPHGFKDGVLPLLLLAGTASGYYMFNDGLNNKPNEMIQSLIQKARAQFQKPKVNEQK